MQIPIILEVGLYSKFLIIVIIVTGVSFFIWPVIIWPIIVSIPFKPNIEKMFAKNDIAGLVSALKYSRDPEIPRRAADALIKIGPPAGYHLLELLRQDCTAINDPLAEEVFVNIARSDPYPLINLLLDAKCVDAVMRLCIRIGEFCVPFILDAVNRHCISLEQTKRFFVEIGDSAIDRLVDTLHLPSGWTRDHWDRQELASSLLVDLARPKAIMALIRAFLEQETVQENAVSSLTQIGKNFAKGEVTQPLIQLLEAYLKQDWRKMEQYVPLALLRNPSEDSQAQDNFNIKTSWTAIRAIQVLGNLREQGAVDVLVEFIDECARRIRYSQDAFANFAIKALLNIGAPELWTSAEESLTKISQLAYYDDTKALAREALSKLSRNA